MAGNCRPGILILSPGMRMFRGRASIICSTRLIKPGRPMPMGGIPGKPGNTNEGSVNGKTLMYGKFRKAEGRGRPRY